MSAHSSSEHCELYNVKFHSLHLLLEELFDNIAKTRQGPIEKNLYFLFPT